MLSQVPALCACVVEDAIRFLNLPHCFQGLQAVRGVSPSDIQKLIDVKYAAVSAVLMPTCGAMDGSLSRLTMQKCLKVCL